MSIHFKGKEVFRTIYNELSDAEKLCLTDAIVLNAIHNPSYPSF